MTMLQAGKHHNQPCISVEAACRAAAKAISGAAADPKAPQAELRVLDRVFASKLTRGIVPNSHSSSCPQERC